MSYGFGDEEKGIELSEIPKPSDLQARYSKTHKELYDTPEKVAFSENNCFSTGEKIDAILAFELPVMDDSKKAEIFKKAVEPENDDDSNEVKKMKRRVYFEASMVKDRVKAALSENLKKLEAGVSAEQRDDLEKLIEFQRRSSKLELRLEREMANDGRIFFVKVHAPFEALCAQAEKVRLALPIKASKTAMDQFSATSEKKKSRPCDALQRLGDDPYQDQEDFYSAPFTLAELDMFQNSDHPEKIFSNAQRSLLVANIMAELAYKPEIEGSASLGITRLIAMQVYKDAFPLHEGKYTEPIEDNPTGSRFFLHEKWAAWKNWNNPQPIDRIREYFGEKIAFYFLWLGFYTRWLIIPAIIGFMAFIYGVAHFSDQTDGKEFCDFNVTMCGICETCDKWQLVTQCTAYKVRYIFDNPATVAFALIMSLWATLFLEFWKRECARAAYDWDVMEFEETEPQRPQFRPTGIRPHPVTGNPTKYYPENDRLKKLALSFLLVFFMLTCVIWTVIGVIIFRILVRKALYSDIEKESAFVTSILAAMLQLVLIVFLNKVYGKLAVVLTDWENHETDSQYEKNLTLKLLLFQFINLNSSIFYLAYFQGNFVGRPGDYNTIFGVRQDDCPEYGCFIGLTIQLTVIFVGRQIISNVQEVFVPKLMDWWLTRQALKRSSQVVFNSSWEDELQLVQYPPLGTLFEYLEMVLQFGFVSMFVAAFPLAPFFALINNIFEIRVDALKLVRHVRRPFAMRAENIGIWESLLNTISIISVITNAFVIAVPSDFIPKTLYYYQHNSLEGFVNASYAYSPVSGPGYRLNEQDCYYKAYRDSTGEYTSFYYESMMARLAFVICFEHFVFAVKFLIAYLVPDVPSEITLSIARQEYQTRQAMEEVLLEHKKTA